MRESLRQARVDSSPQLRAAAILMALHDHGLGVDEAMLANVDGVVEPARRRSSHAEGAVDLAAKVEQLEVALVTRTVIGQALGILMERHKITSDEAIVVLRAASNVTGCKLRDLAARIATTGSMTSEQ